MFCNKFGKEFGSNELFLSMWNLKETRTEKCVAQFVRWEVCHRTLLWKRISLWYYCLVFRKKGWRAFGFTFNHNHYNFLKCDCCISCFTFHWSLCKIVTESDSWPWSETFNRTVKAANHTKSTHWLNPPLCGRPILLITRTITDRIGLHSVLLPLLIISRTSCSEWTSFLLSLNPNSHNLLFRVL